MKIFFQYLIVFILIIFILPAVLTHHAKLMVSAESNTVEEQELQINLR